MIRRGFKETRKGRQKKQKSLCESGPSQKNEKNRGGNASKARGGKEKKVIRTKVRRGKTSQKESLGREKETITNRKISTFGKDWKG